MENKSAEGVADHRSEEFAPYPKIDPRDLEPPPPPVVASSTAAVQSEKEAAALSTATVQSEKEAAASSAANPYVLSAPPNSSVPKNKMESVRETLGRWGKKAAEATKATEDYTGSVWQHLKTAPNVADAAMGMIAQSTKVIAEGGYDKIFQSTFETLPDEQLKKSYRCYLSTSAGPVMGIMYLSSEKLAFCSDNALSYKVGDKTEWSFYKVMIPLNQLRTVNPSANKANASEKYIQVVSVDDHEFWFMGIVNYQDAVKSLQEIPRGPNLQP